MARFDEQPNDEVRMWRAIGFGLAWTVFAAAANDIVINSDSRLVACVVGWAVGFGLFLAGALLSRDDENDIGLRKPVNGALELVRRSFVFVLVGLFLAKLGYDMAVGLDRSEIRAFQMLGFLLGPVSLWILMPRLRRGRKV